MNKIWAIVMHSLNTCSSFHVCLYVLDISKTAAATQTGPGIRDLAVKIILQKLFCFADKFRKLLTLQFNSCLLYNRTVYNRARVCVKSYLLGGKKKLKIHFTPFKMYISIKIFSRDFLSL